MAATARGAHKQSAHPQPGAIFESWVAAEIAKAHLHRGEPADVHHLRQTRGREVDRVVGRGRRLMAVECKSGQTVSGDAVRALDRACELLRGANDDLEALDAVLVHGGADDHTRRGVRVLPWESVAAYPWVREPPPERAP